MSYKPRWDNGGWNVICDACGRKFKEHELQLRWDGLMVCKGDWEPRHPQDFVKGVADIQAPKYARPEQQDQFIPVNFEVAPYEDKFEFEELFVKSTTLKFGAIPLASKSSVNGVAINVQALNVTVANGYVDPEAIEFSESMVFTSSHGIMETTSVAESVSTVLVLGASRMLNGSALNSLGVN